MNRARWTAAPLALAVALAGCLAPDAASEPVAPAGAADGTATVPPAAEPDGANATALPPAVARAVVTTTNGTITQVAASAAFDGANLILGGPVVAGENVAGDFEPGANATGIIVELAWSDATWDLDLYVRAPDAEEMLLPESSGGGFTTTRGHVWAANGGNTGSPDGVATVLVFDPEAIAIPGTWSWVVDSKTAREVAFTVHVSVFYDGVPGGDYTAVAR